MTTASFTGTVVLVTGVGRSGQVGEVVARAFGERGAHVALVDRDGASAAERAAELHADGVTATSFGCDLSDPAQVAQLADSVSRIAPQGLKALVNAAGGFASSGIVAESDPSTWFHQVSINLTTAYLTTRAHLPLLRAAQGAVVFFAAPPALPGGKPAGLSAYAAAKAGVVTLMRSVAAEERPHSVRANAIAPIAIRTAANLRAMGESATYVDRETVADWVLWLCAAHSGPITGQVFKLG